MSKKTETSGVNRGTGYEKALKGLMDAAEKMGKKDLSLEETIKCYEEGMAYYEECREIIEKAKQNIEIFQGEIDA